MEKPISYKLGQLASKLSPSGVVLVVCVGAVVVLAFSESKEGLRPAAVTMAPQPFADPMADKCREARSASVAEYQSLLPSDPWKAANSIRRCAHRLQDAELLALVSSAEKADQMKMARNAKSQPEDRLRALDKLLSGGEPSTVEWERLRAQLVKRIAANQAKAEKNRLAQKKREGVAIGATKQDALESSWGKPERVNTTIRARGVLEQWVYPGSNYLYFENGVLVTIQTGN